MIRRICTYRDSRARLESRVYTRSQKRTYQIDNPKKARISSMKTRSSIKSPRAGLIRLATTSPVSVQTTRSAPQWLCSAASSKRQGWRSERMTCWRNRATIHVAVETASPLFNSAVSVRLLQCLSPSGVVLRRNSAGKSLTSIGVVAGEDSIRPSLESPSTRVSARCRP
jgi:hypothetical protein